MHSHAGAWERSKPLKRPYILGLRTFWSLCHIKFHFLVFLQAFVSSRGNCRVMGKNIRTPIIRGNKTEALLRVEPLHSTRCHCLSPYTDRPALHARVDGKRINALGFMDHLKRYLLTNRQCSPMPIAPVDENAFLLVIQRNQPLSPSQLIGFDSTCSQLQYRSPLHPVYYMREVLAICTKQRHAPFGYCQS
ncbi:hypothetical protein PFLU3_33370 [Pseudomonas fluorescens]|uniref:Uncharacterized protein n=1 Tax=Pseudomonas fluorescens TaxID=294 RepID=A0A0D0TCJ6_PSEFL|nr:hypothetical protein PFLU3_33370 [Pseudomonas fluorescens]